MKKLLIAVAVLVGIAFLAKRFAPDLSKIDWEKKFEAMPDNAPPKWMFNEHRRDPRQHRTHHRAAGRRDHTSRSEPEVIEGSTP